jgi:hypothetical protein
MKTHIKDVKLEDFKYGQLEFESSVWIPYVAYAQVDI